MAELLTKMAQQARNQESLLASLIAQQCERRGITWEMFGARLGLEAEQLARLALCRRPRNDTIGQDLAQIAQYVSLEKEKMAQVARELGYPVRVNQAAASEKRPLPATPNLFNRLKSGRVIALGLSMLVFLALAAFAVAQSGNPEATLVVFNGQVIVSQNRNSLFIFPQESEVALATGKVLVVRAGDVIRLPENAAAELRLQDGSTVELLANSTLELSELIIDGNSYQVRLSLLAGRTINRVVRLLGLNDRFDVRTPSSTATVRGTVFVVEVLSPTASYYAVEEGTVWVQMGEETVEVTAGYAVTAVLGQPLIVQPIGYTAAAPVTSEELVTLCHYPPGNTGNPQTIQVSPEDVAAHLAHGDAMGACTETPTPIATNTPQPTLTAQPARNVTLCHVPVGNSGNPQTIVVAPESVQAHLAHGDYLGPCLTPTPVPLPTATPVPIATNTPVPLPTDTPPPATIIICHYPPGNPDRPQTIEIPESDWPGHEGHGDTLGPCP